MVVISLKYCLIYRHFEFVNICALKFEWIGNIFNCTRPKYFSSSLKLKKVYISGVTRTNVSDRLLAMLYPDRDRLRINIRAIFHARKLLPKWHWWTNWEIPPGNPTRRLNVVTWLLTYITGMRDYTTLSYRKYICEWRHDFDSWSLKTYTIYTPAKILSHLTRDWVLTKIWPWTSTILLVTALVYIYTIYTYRLVPMHIYRYIMNKIGSCMEVLNVYVNVCLLMVENHCDEALCSLSYLAYTMYAVTPGFLRDTFGNKFRGL